MQTPGPDDQALHDYSAVHDYLDDAADDNDEGHDDDYGSRTYYHRHYAEYDGINHYHDEVVYLDLRRHNDDLRRFVVEYLHRLDDFGRAVTSEFGHFDAAHLDLRRAERALRSAVDGG